MSRPIISDAALVEAPSLKRELNDALTALALQQGAGVKLQLLERVLIETKAVVSASFPFTFGGPEGFTAAGLLLVQKEILTAASTLFSSAVDFHWSPTPDGRIQLRNMTGLSVNTRYRFTFLAIGEG